jgi:Protein of unknown function (DUF2842)
MALAQSALVKANGVIELIYYVVAGLGWVLPAMPLIRWMSRPDPLKRASSCAVAHAPGADRGLTALSLGHPSGQRCQGPFRPD